MNKQLLIFLLLLFWIINYTGQESPKKNSIFRLWGIQNYERVAELPLQFQVPIAQELSPEI